MPKRCLKCATDNRGEALFCRRCGVPFSDSLAVPPAEEPTVPGARSAVGSSWEGSAANGVFASESQPPWAHEPTLDLPRSPTAGDNVPVVSSDRARPTLVKTPLPTPHHGAPTVAATAGHLAALDPARLPAGGRLPDPTAAEVDPPPPPRPKASDDRESRRGRSVTAMAMVGLASLLGLAWWWTADRASSPADVTLATLTAHLPAQRSPAGRGPGSASTGPGPAAAATAVLPPSLPNSAPMPAVSEARPPPSPATAAFPAAEAAPAVSSVTKVDDGSKASRQARSDRPARTREPRGAYDRATGRPATLVAAVAHQGPGENLRTTEPAPHVDPARASPVLQSGLKAAVESVCAGHGTIATAICESRACGRPEHRDEPRCQQVNADEERRR